MRLTKDDIFILALGYIGGLATYLFAIKPLLQ